MRATFGVAEADFVSVRQPLPSYSVYSVAVVAMVKANVIIGFPAG